MAFEKHALVLLLGTSFLVACGGEKKSEEAVASMTEAESSEAQDVGEIEIPDIPADTLPQINARKSAAYVEDFLAQEGVQQLAGGFLIQHVEEGEGEAPGESDFILFHYKRFTMDGQLLDDTTSLETTPVVQSYTQVGIPGFPEAVAKMKAGGKARVVVPPELAFGEEGIPGVVQPNEALIFEIDLVEVVTEAETERRDEIIAQQEAMMAEREAAQAAEQAERQKAFEELAAKNAADSAEFLAAIEGQDGIQKTESGVLYEVLEDGGDGVTPDPEDTVTVHYRGTLPDGRVFDSSFTDDEPMEGQDPSAFRLDGVIRGWTEGVGAMNVGDTYRLYIPAELAYGPRGGSMIGPNQALVFDVTLLNIQENGETETEDTAAPAETEAE